MITRLHSAYHRLRQATKRGSVPSRLSCRAAPPTGDKAEALKKADGYDFGGRRSG